MSIPEGVDFTALIPARYASTRLPGKPLADLGGRPMVVHVAERARASGALRVVIATDDARIADAVRAHGFDALMTRADHATGTDRLAEAAALLGLGDDEIVVNVQGDEPFINGAALQGAAGCVTGGRFELGTAAAHAPLAALETPHVVKVVCADDGRALYFSRAGIPALRDGQDLPVLEGTVRQHIGVYAYTPRALRRWVSLPEHPLERIERLEQLRPLAAGMAMGVATIDEAPPGGLDTEDDLTRANENWTHLSADVK